jgi:hypothetical protein
LWIVLVVAGATWMTRIAAGSAGAATAAESAAGRAEGAAGETRGQPAGDEGDTGSGEAAAEIQAGPPLAGYFDLSVLRASFRVNPMRQALDPMQVQLDGAWRAEIRCTVEFGSPSGLAELGRIRTAVMEDLIGAAAQFKAAQLLTPAGKLSLKDEMVRAMDRRLKTARVRQIYYTDFRIAQ